MKTILRAYLVLHLVVFCAWSWIIALVGIANQDAAATIGGLVAGIALWRLARLV